MASELARRCATRARLNYSIVVKTIVAAETARAKTAFAMATTDCRREAKR